MQSVLLTRNMAGNEKQNDEFRTDELIDYSILLCEYICISFEKDV